MPRIPGLAATAVALVLLAGCAADTPAPAEGTPPASPPSMRSTPTPTPPPSAPEATATAAPSDGGEGPRAVVHEYDVEVFPLPSGSRPHDAAPAADGGVWYTAQPIGELGWLDPRSGEVRRIPLGAGSRPHGVILGPDGHAWVTDSGLNAIVRVNGETDKVTVFRLPADRPNANLNTAAFDGSGRLWFTGQAGVIGVLDPASGEMSVYDAPRGRGPYGIDTTPDGDVYFASLAASYVGRIDLDSGAVEVLEPPTARQGARRVWSDSAGAIWVSEWNAGNVARYEPASGEWAEWALPGSAQPYSVYVDERDVVWLTDFRANALVWFDPRTEEFGTIPLPAPNASVRQMLGRDGEVYAPMSSADAIVVVRYPS